MSSHIQVKVPRPVRRALRQWVADFREGTRNHPAHPGDEFVAQIERLARSSGTRASISQIALAKLVKIAAGHLNFISTPGVDLRIALNQSVIKREARLILDWCATVSEIDIRDELIVISLPR